MIIPGGILSGPVTSQRVYLNPLIVNPSSLNEGIASPIGLKEHPANVRMPAPEFSQHTDEVLLEGGYSMDEIIEFKAQGIIF